MTLVDLEEWIQHPDRLDRDTLYELRTLVTRYPYFQSIRLLYLKNLYLLHDATFGEELRKAALYVADRRALFSLLEGDKYTSPGALKAKKAKVDDLADEPTLDRTLTLIDKFLSSVPQEQNQQTDFDYSTDYTAYLLEEKEDSPSLAEQEEKPQLRGHELIDGFIEKNNAADVYSLRLNPLSSDESEKSDDSYDWQEDKTLAATNVVTEIVDDEEDDTCFTETLAKIYVKQQRYSKALEIIEKLNLKYPKKNAYFADQIRFLKKLIINAKSK